MKVHFWPFTLENIKHIKHKVQLQLSLVLQVSPGITRVSTMHPKVEIFHLKPQMWTLWWCKIKSQGITNIIRICCLGTINLCTKWLAYPSDSCWAISVWTIQHSHLLSYTAGVANKKKEERKTNNVNKQMSKVPCQCFVTDTAVMSENSLWGYFSESPWINSSLSLGFPFIVSVHFYRKKAWESLEPLADRWFWWVFPEHTKAHIWHLSFYQ